MQEDKQKKSRSALDKTEIINEHVSGGAKESAYPEDDYWRAVGDKSQLKPDSSVDPENGLRWEKQDE